MDPGEAPVCGQQAGVDVETGQGPHLQGAIRGHPQAGRAATGGEEDVQGGRPALRGVQKQVLLDGQWVWTHGGLEKCPPQNT